MGSGYTPVLGRLIVGEKGGELLTIQFNFPIQTILIGYTNAAEKSIIPTPSIKSKIKGNNAKQDKETLSNP